MALNSYFAARQFVVTLGNPLLLLLLIFSVGFAIASFLKAYQKHIPLFLTVLFSSFLLGFALIVWLHWQITSTLVLADPTSQLPAGRFYIPPWVENEKLFFWGLVLSFLTLFIKKQPLKFKQAVLVSLAIFLVLIYFTSNPFAGVGPLSEFHQAYGRYVTVMTSSQSLMVKSQIYHQLHGKMVGFYNSSYMWIHPPLLFFSYSLFVFAFLASLFMFSGAKQMPEHFDKLAYSYTKPGFIFLTVGLLLGYPWAVEAWSGESWWYDPKINITLMMWLLYAAYLHARLYWHRRWMPKVTAVLAYTAFFSVIVTYISSYVIPGIHSVAGGG